MKIKLVANAQIQLPENLSHVDASYGFSYFDSKNNEYTNFREDNSFSVKLLARLEKTFNLGLNDTQKNFTDIVARAIDYSNRTYSADNAELIEGIKVQINAKTPLNEKLNKFAQKYLKKSVADIKSVLDNFNHSAGHIKIHYKQIELGTEHNVFQAYQNDENFDKTGKIRQYLTKERMIEFMFFHELGHHLEFSHKKNYTQGIFMSIYNKMSSLQADSTSKLILNIQAQINNSGFKEQLGTVNQNFMKQVRSLAMECYADTSAILSQRNYHIEQSVQAGQTYDENHTNGFIEALAQYRKMSHVKARHASGYKDTSSLDFALASEHVTSNALDGLAQRIDALDKDNDGNRQHRILTVEEIHQVAQEATEQAMARMIYASAHMDAMTQQQLLILCNTGFNQDIGVLEINPDIDEGLYPVATLLELMKPFAGETWVENFNARIERLEGTELEKILKAESVLDIAVRPEKFDMDLNSCITWNNAEMKACYIESIIDEDIIDTDKDNLTNEVAIRLKALEDKYLPVALNDNPQRSKANLPDGTYFKRLEHIEEMAKLEETVKKSREEFMAELKTVQNKMQKDIQERWQNDDNAKNNKTQKKFSLSQVLGKMMTIRESSFNPNQGKTNENSKNNDLHNINPIIEAGKNKP